jgi:hypothetical protein
MPAAKPISIGSYLFGMFIGASAAFVISLADDFTRGNTDAAFGIVLIPFFWLLPGVVGLVPFLLLRKAAPNQVLGRFVFIIMVLAPIISLICLVGRPSLIKEHWAITIIVTYIGGLACWSSDQIASLLPVETPSVVAKLVDRSLPSMFLLDPELFVNFPIVSDNHSPRDHSARRAARYLTVGSLIALTLPIVLLFTCNQFLVEYRAENIAGDRPYCILVANDAASPIYETATQRSAFVHAYARKVRPTRGIFYEQPCYPSARRSKRIPQLVVSFGKFCSRSRAEGSCC